MAKYSKPERIREIIRKRLRGEPIASISAEMGISRSYIYSLLSRLPKTENLGKPKAETYPVIQFSKEIQIVMDYLEYYPSQKKREEYGKKSVDEIVIRTVADMHNLPEEQVTDILCRVTDLHPMISHFPLYSNIEKWKTNNLITMRQLADAAGISIQGMNRILSGMNHMPLETARKIQRKSGLSLYEIYSDLIEQDKRFGKAGKHEK